MIAGLFNKQGDARLKVLEINADGFHGVMLIEVKIPSDSCRNVTEMFKCLCILTAHFGVSGFVAQRVKINANSVARCLDSDVYTQCSFFRCRNDKNRFSRHGSRGRVGCEEPHESRRVRALSGSWISRISSKEQTVLCNNRSSNQVNNQLDLSHLYTLT